MPRPDPQIQRIRARMPDFVDRMIDLALGVQMLAEDGSTVYTKAPDRHALEYLINRVLGRPAGAKEERPAPAIAGRVVITLPDNGRDATAQRTGHSHPPSAGSAVSVPGDAG